MAEGAAVLKEEGQPSTSHVDDASLADGQVVNPISGTHEEGGQVSSLISPSSEDLPVQLAMDSPSSL